jgi:hypothetical protein
MEIEPHNDTDDKEISSSDKKRRRTASRLHVVPSESVVKEKNPPSVPDAKSETRKNEPRSLGELFEHKAAEITPPPKQPEDSQTATETIDESGQLTSHAKQAAASTLSEARLANIDKHDNDEEITSEAAEDLGAERLHKKIASGMDPEEAEAETMAEMGATPDEIEAVIADIPSPSLGQESDDEFADDVDGEDYEDVVEPASEVEITDLPAEEVVFERHAPDQAGTDRQESEDSSSETAHDPNYQLNTSKANSASMGSYEEEELSESNVPPRPPADGPPSGPNFMTPDGPDGFDNGRRDNPNDLHSARVMSGNINTPTSTEIYDSGNPAVTALIGYLIGRRHGRRKGIKMEHKARLKSERKLKNQIEDIDWQLQAKEQRIRKLAAEKARQQRDMYIVPKQDKENIRLPDKPSEKVRNIISDENSRRQETTVNQFTYNRQAAPEASHLHGATKSREHIGHMLVNAAELPLVAISLESSKTIRETNEEKKPKTSSEEKIKLPDQKHIETLNRSELLSLSEKIVVDGSSLRQVYETHLIGERGLRRLVAEYLQGGDVKKILRREIVEHEIDFERDPAVRDVTVPSSLISKSSGVSSKTALDKMVEQASVTFDDSNAQSYYKARAALDAEDKRRQTNKRRAIDVSLTSTIVLLLTLVLILFINRH